MLSIITINYNGSQDTIKLLESLKRQTDKDFEIIIIDNKSSPEDIQTLQNFIETRKNNFNSLELIKSEKNLGFSGGNNLGIKQALRQDADWIVLLNNDSWVETNFIARLKPELNATEADMVGIPLNEGGRVAYCGKIEWLKPTLSHVYEPISRLNKKSIYVIGGAMAINRKVFEKIGHLDENYFLYFEDADFSKKTLAAGFKIKILPNPKAHHAVSSATNKLGSPLLLRYHYRNALYFNFKNGPWYIKIIVWPWSWLIILKQIFKLLIGHHSAQSRAVISGVLDFYLRRMRQI